MFIRMSKLLFVIQRKRMDIYIAVKGQKWQQMIIKIVTVLNIH